MNLDLILQESAAILASVGRSFVHILPYLALSIPLAVLLKRTGAADRIRKGRGANPYLAVLLATFVGALSPFCSCGVIPIITALLLGGVPLAPVMSFWLASPSMDPEIFVLSVGSIGWNLAIWRLGATFAMSLGGGLLVLWIERLGWVGWDFLRPSVLGKAGTGTGPEPVLVPDLRTLEPASACCAALREIPMTFVLDGQGDGGCGRPCGAVPAPLASGCACGGKKADPAGSGWRGLLGDTVRTALNLSLYMGIAFLLEAVILRYVPQDLIASRLGARSAWSVPLATLIGIPMYTTNLTSLGLVSGLLQRGMSGGAALAFLVGGAVTTFPAMSAVYGIVRWRVFALYLGLCVSGAMISGFAYQFAQAFWR